VKRVLLLILALGIASAASAVDFGLAVSAEPAYEADAGGELPKLTMNYTPWFSHSFNEKVGLYVSARFGFEKEFTDEPSDDRWYELNRTELTLRPAETAYLTLGRQWYRDDAGMIAAGLFDGLSASFGLGRALLRGGVYSSALIYKKTTEIRMTAKDWEIYGDSDRYIGSNRLLAVLGGDFPDLSSKTSLSVSALGQFDLNDQGTGDLHSQYLTALYRIELLDPLRLSLTALGGMTERNEDFRSSFAGVLGLDWDLPGNLADMLTGELQWRSGAVNDDIGPFTPVTVLTRGTVYTPPLAGLMDARLSYTARLHRTLSLNALSVLFIRTDVETFTDPDLDAASKDRYVGVEFYGQMIWAPQSPLRITVGGGAFLPGNVFVTTDPRWKINAGIVLSL
jgi:hypothetical protein